MALRHTKDGHPYQVPPYTKDEVREMERAGLYAAPISVARRPVEPRLPNKQPPAQEESPRGRELP